jgi:hypothetical protein
MGGAEASGGGGAGGIGAGGQGGCPDADGDGFADAACGGSDCADEDDRAFPGQTSFFNTPIVGATVPGTLPYDFSCDGLELKDQSQILAACGGACNLAGYGAASVCGSDVGYLVCFKPSLLECKTKPANAPTALRCH